MAMWGLLDYLFSVFEIFNHRHPSEANPPSSLLFHHPLPPPPVGTGIPQTRDNMLIRGQDIESMNIHIITFVPLLIMCECLPEVQ